MTAVETARNGTRRLRAVAEEGRARELPRVPLEVEQAVLGAALQRPELLRDAEFQLASDDFFDARNQAIWGAMAELDAEGQAIDELLLEEALRRNGKSQMVGGLAYLGQLRHKCAFSERGLDYAALMRGQARLRQTMTGLSELAERGYEPDVTADELLAAARARLDTIHARMAPVAAGALRRAVDVLGDLAAEAALPYVSTGLSCLDEQLGGGLRARTMTLLVAGTGRGKTSLAAQIGAQHAERAPALYYSAELTPAQLVARVLAQRTGRSWREVLAGGLSDAAMRGVLDPLSLFVMGRVPDPVAALEAAADGLLARGEGVPLLVIDYAQLVADVTAEMRLSVMDAVRGVHRLTESRDVATLLLAQGNRASSRAMRQGDGGATEFVNAGAETAALEQSASTVLALLYQPEDGAIEHDVTVAIAKSRYGAPGKVGLRFHGPSGLWEPLHAAPPPPAERGRRDEVLAVLHASEPMTATAVAKAVGGRKQAALDTIRALAGEGRIRELPGGGLVLGGGR